MTRGAEESRSLVRRALLAAAAACATISPFAAVADQQRDPELRAVVQDAIANSDCFIDKYDSEVWFKLMEPKLRRTVKDQGDRLKILRMAYCEANRADAQRLPPGLIMAVIDVESRFERWAVSSAGAVGLMQVMPFWPEQLGMRRHQLVEIEHNMRMGCAILRFYMKREKNDVRKALARYNGSVGRREYPDLVITRWTRSWNFADDLGKAAGASGR